MIKLLLNNKLYSKSFLFSFLENNNITKGKIEELYKIYSSERNNNKVKENDKITKKDIAELITIAEKLLRDVGGLLK